jgi:hypothetical protein
MRAKVTGDGSVTGSARNFLRIHSKKKFPVKPTTLPSPVTKWGVNRECGNVGEYISPQPSEKIPIGGGRENITKHSDIPA